MSARRTSLGIEIERKFLLSSEAWRHGPDGPREGLAYRQGYLGRDQGPTVRVRVAGDQGFLTIKGPTTGATRQEFEYPIPEADALALLALCQGPVIEKIRYRISFAGLVWEVDEFLGANQGLVVAEVELPSEDTPVSLPPWVGLEVTADPRYANSRLAVQPYSLW